MIRKKSRQGRIREPEDIIFLGAGASASEGAPVQSRLFSEFFRTGGRNPDNSASSERLRQFFHQFFGIDIEAGGSGILYPSFEETLGILEIAMDRGEGFKGYSIATHAPDVQTIREDLIFLIALVLNQTLVKSRGHHDILVRRLADEGRIGSTAFISLNYDILIDNALGLLYPGFDIDYGVSFTNYSGAHGLKARGKGKAVLLYKLHGSMNWLYCPTCISLTLTPGERKASPLAEKPVPCVECGMPTAPIISPPTYLKGMKNIFLSEIMHKAENALRHVRRLIFCGYSFPDADLLVRYLLKRVEMNYDPMPEIYVINEHKGKRVESREIEEQRYRRFFRDKGRVRYLDLTFMDFCLHGLGRP